MHVHYNDYIIEWVLTIDRSGAASEAAEMISSIELNPFSRRVSLRDKGLRMSAVEGILACFGIDSA